MLAQPFLTELDKRAEVKGSRDPLGVMAVWTHFGRHVVGNLTTVSTSLRDFTTLLLGYYFTERVANEGGTEGELATFLKWEQLAAYARFEMNADKSFRGTERVQKNLSEGRRVRLSVEAAAQILGNQKIYGLWGLYTVPARSSGLVEGSPARLTTPARDLVSALYLPVFAAAGFRNADAVVGRLKEKHAVIDVDGRDRRLLEAIGKILERRVLAKESAVYRRHLLLGGERASELQELLALLLTGTLGGDWKLSPPNVRALAQKASEHGDRGERLASRLEEIRTCELLVAPAVALFDFLLGYDGRTVSQAARDLGDAWGTSLRTIDAGKTAALESELAAASKDAVSGARWMRLARALAAGAYDDALLCLIEHNRFVMHRRSGAASWIDVIDGKLHVRFRDQEGSRLPPRDDLPEYWKHSYFIDSLRWMALALKE